MRFHYHGPSIVPRNRALEKAANVEHYQVRRIRILLDYALNVFDWINEKKLKKERDNLQEKIARNKYNLTELEKRIAQLV